MPISHINNTQSIYPLAQSTFSTEEIAVAKAVIDSGIFTMGQQVKAFETEFEEWTGSTHALMVNSGSSANLLMIDALIRPSKGAPRLKRGDEVLVPALSWPTTVWPLLQLGLVPVFVDIDPTTMAIDLESAETCLTSKTKAIFLIHVLGQIADIKQLLGFCSRHHLFLIEDVCESLGAHDNRTHAGTFGLMGSFSCYFSHHISTIEGGMIITKDEDLFNDLKSLRSHGWVRDRSDKQDWIQENPDIDPRFLFIMAGYNVRPTEIQAAIGRVQLKKLDTMLESREKMALGTQKIIEKNTPWIKLIGADHLKSLKNGKVEKRARSHSWMSLPFLLTDNAPANVEQVKALFENLGIETRPIIAGNLAKHPSSKAYGIRAASSLANADNVLKNGFMIGCHPFNWKKNLTLLEDAFLKTSKL